MTVVAVPDLIAAKKAGGVRPLGSSVSNCSFSGSNYAGYWTNCIARGSSPTLSLAFRFSYQNIQGQGSSITGYCCAEHTAVGGTWSDGHWQTPYRNYLRYAGTWTAYNNITSNSRYLEVSTNGSAVTAYFH